MKRNASGGRIRGGSTISQQTAKNAFLWQGGGYARKGMEAWFTVLIEAMWPKRRIMEVYLNIAETGIGTYGANAGSQRYFGHDASAMSRTEAARIAAVLPLPKTRGAIAPKGFTRRYGNTIAARIGVVGRDGLDACVYQGTAAPPTGRRRRPRAGRGRSRARNMRRRPRSRRSRRPSTCPAPRRRRRLPNNAVEPSARAARRPGRTSRPAASAGRSRSPAGLTRSSRPAPAWAVPGPTGRRCLRR